MDRACGGDKPLRGRRRRAGRSAVVVAGELELRAVERRQAFPLDHGLDVARVFEAELGIALQRERQNLALDRLALDAQGGALAAEIRIGQVGVEIVHIGLDRRVEALERGEIKPLEEILALVRDQLKGRIVGVEIEREKGRWMYEFRLVDDRGRVSEAYVDGLSGKVDKIERK